MRSFFAVSLFTLSPALLLAALMPGCEGGQTGDLSGSHGGSSNLGETGGGCDEHKTKLAGLDTKTDAGTAEDVLAYSEKSFDAPIVWQTAGEGQSWTLAPETGEGKLHLEVTRGKTAYQLSYTASTNGSNLEAGSICPPPALGVDVHVDVKTDGGALAESFDTLLRSSTPGVAQLDVPLDLSKLGGALKVSFPDSSSKLVQPHLRALLASAGMTGTLEGMQQTTSGEVASASQVLLAVWPGDAACATASSSGEGIATATDAEVLGSTGADVITALAPAKPIAVTWLNGGDTTLDLTVKEQGDGCFLLDSTKPIEIGGGPQVSYPVLLSLKSADKHLDGSYQGQIVVHQNGSDRTVEADAQMLLAPADVAQSGFSNVKVPSDANQVSLELHLQVRDGMTSGSVRLMAISSPPCVTSPPPPMSSSSGASAPGCAGSMIQQLEAASW